MDKIKGEKVTKNIYRCPDGKYRWIYELNLLKNPLILLTVLKIFGIAFLLITFFEFMLEVFDGNARGFVKNFILTPGFLILPAVLLGLAIVGYIILAAIYGWKYIVLFEMDEESIAHKQLPKQFKKAEALGWLATMAGAASGNMFAMGAGIYVTGKDMSISNYANVKKIVKKKLFDTIKVNETMEHNQIYAEKEDFGFVWTYISCRCKNAKIVE